MDKVSHSVNPPFFIGEGLRSSKIRGRGDQDFLVKMGWVSPYKGVSLEGGGVSTTFH